MHDVDGTNKCNISGCTKDIEEYMVLEPLVLENCSERSVCAVLGICRHNKVLTIICTVH